MKSDSFSATVSRRRFVRQAACAALGTAAVTNAITDLRLINVALAQNTPSDYKALVCIFLSGGNDAHNLLIPNSNEDYQAYASIRGPVLTIPRTDGSPATALLLKGTDAEGRSYGIHPACPELQALYNSGKLATIFNVGTLVYPLTKADYNSGSVPRPFSIGSHGDQSSQWQSSISDGQQGSGWGGRCADLLDTLNPKNGNNDVLSLCISLAGNNLFEVGGVARPYIMGSGGVSSLNDGSIGNGTARIPRLQATKNLVGIGKVQNNMLIENYALALDHSLSLGSSLASTLGSSPMKAYWGTYPTSFTVPNGGPANVGSGIMAQLRMVAQVIEAGYRSAAQGGLGMRRQIFFCQTGGFDTHFNQTNNSANPVQNAAQVIQGSQANLLAELSQAINGFQNAMAKIGQQYGDAAFEKRVTAFTSSDFGRGLAGNGFGCDHGWGAHHLVTGGAVVGGKSYGKFPAMATNGPDDIGGGRLLPTTSVDQFAATLAKWFGVDQTHMSTVFPNLGRFDVPYLGFLG